MKRQDVKGITLIALVITIIVLLILAGVSIAMLTGPNGLLTQANTAKTKTSEAGAKEKVQIAVAGSYGENGFDKKAFKEEIEETFNGKITSEDETDPIIVEMDGYEVEVDAETGEVKGIKIGKEEEENYSPEEVPELWEVTSKKDSEWYSYGGAKVNAPKLKGGMAPIKYTGEIASTEATSNNKWANAITTDGSMWVWIPRYAYKITEGYHTSTAGTIEVAFVDTKNNFLNEESGEITDDPSKVTYTDEGVQEQWLVHPAFTSSAENGGGFGELEGLWVGKFEATGTYDSESKTGTLSVKPGIASLRSITINDQYRLAKSSTFGESVTAEKLGSHMAKNSEWGVVAYLGHSEYGTKGEEVEQNKNESYYTGGSNTKKDIYTTNKTQSTTHNATGVYDMIGGAYEYVASYVYNPSTDYLTINGGDQDGDLCDNTAKESGEETKREESTAYKTVYAQGSSDSGSSNYEKNARMKGDAVWETSNKYDYRAGAWFSAYARFPYESEPFFRRGGFYGVCFEGTFFFHFDNGDGSGGKSFRPVLAF